MPEEAADFLKQVEKVWGMEYWLVNTELYCLKTLVVIPGGHCSLHHHAKKDETFWIDSGVLFLELDGKEHELHPGSRIRIKPNQQHRFWVPKGFSAPCRFFEVSTHHDDGDVVRIHESYKE